MMLSKLLTGPRGRALVLGAVLGATLSGCGGADARKEKYLERGMALFAEANYEKARLEFRNVLQIEPANEQARLMLARVFIAEKNYKKAAKEFMLILDANPDNVEAMAGVGKLYLLAQQRDQVRTYAQRIRELKPGHPGGLVLEAGLAASEQDYDAAVAAAKAALAAEPGMVDATALLASIYSTQGRVAEAAEVLEKAIALHPEETDLKIILAQTYLSNERGDEAVTVLREVLAADPSNREQRLRLANVLSVLDRKDEADALLVEAVTADPENSLPKLDHVQFLQRMQGNEAGLAQLKSYIDSNPEQHALRFALGGYYESQGAFEDADAVYDAVLAGAAADSPDALKAKVRKAVTLVRRGTPAAAAPLVAEVLEVNPQDRQALLIRGSLAMEDGRPADAVIDYRAAMVDNPNDASTLELLAAAHEAAGERELARENYLKAVDSASQDLAAHKRIAQRLLGMEQIDDARAVLERAQALDATDGAVLGALFRIAVLQNNAKGGLAVARAYQQAAPDKAEPWYFEGLAQQSLGEVDLAVTSYGRALEREPQAVQPLTQLVKLLLGNDRRDEAIDELRATIETTPNHFVAQNLLGEIYLASGDLEPAKTAFEEASVMQPTWAVPYRNLAIAHMQQDNVAAAEKVLRQGIERTEGDASLVTALASVLEKDGRLDEAMASYQQRLDNNPDDLLAANNLAMLLLEYGEDDASVAKAAALAQRLEGQTQPAFIDTLGWLNYRQGNYPKAVELLTRAVEIAPNSAVLQYHLGMAHYRNGNALLAKDHLERATNAGGFRGEQEAQAVLKELAQG